MTTRDTLAHRLRSLMDIRPDLDTQVKVHKRAGISQSSVGRTLNKSAAATVDMVDDLATAFGVDPVELLIADDTQLLLYQRIRALPLIEQAKLMGYLDVVLSGALRDPASIDMAIYRPGSRTMTIVETKPAPPRPNDAALQSKLIGMYSMPELPMESGGSEYDIPVPHAAPSFDQTRTAVDVVLQSMASDMTPILPVTPRPKSKTTR